MQGKKKSAGLVKKNSRHYVGEFLFRFYRKRTTSFLANIYKASITGSPGDIHRARLDVKKILAILGLLGIARSKNKPDPGYEKIYSKLYRASGRIREIQVNLHLLGSEEFASYDLTIFKQELLLQERGRTADLLELIRNFDEHKLSGAERRIKKEVFKISARKLQRRTKGYLRFKTAQISELLDQGPGKRKIHQVRQHIKELSTILSLVNSVSTAGSSEQVIDCLNHCEIIIGNWHDRVVLAQSLKKSLEGETGFTDSQLAMARECRRVIMDTNREQMIRIGQEVRTAIAALQPFFHPRNFSI